MVDFNIKLTGPIIIYRGYINLSWQYAAHNRIDIAYEKRNSQVGYVKDGSFDYHTLFKRSSKDLLSQ